MQHNDTSLQLRGSEKMLSPKHPCLLIKREFFNIQTPKNNMIQSIQPNKWQCMLSDEEDTEIKSIIVDFVGIDDKELDLDDTVESGKTTLFVDGSVVLPDENKMIVPKNGPKVFEKVQTESSNKE